MRGSDVRTLSARTGHVDPRSGGGGVSRNSAQLRRSARSFDGDAELHFTTDGCTLSNWQIIKLRGNSTGMQASCFDQWVDWHLPSGSKSTNQRRITTATRSDLACESTCRERSGLAERHHSQALVSVSQRPIRRSLSLDVSF